MTEPLSYEDWKKKHNISISKISKDIANEHNMISDLVSDNLNDFLKEDYKLYLYQVRNPNWYDTLKDPNSNDGKIRDDWETIVDAAAIQ